MYIHVFWRLWYCVLTFLVVGGLICLIQWYYFEFIVICIGKYGDVPKIPSFPRNKSPEIFDGKVMHCIDYCKLDKDAAAQLLKDKKVAVIGYKKSAIDLALECAEANQGNLCLHIYSHLSSKLSATY